MSLLFAILLAVADGNGTHAGDAPACDGGACEQQAVLRMARQDLSKRLGIPEKEVKTGSVRRL
ncbi:MAG: hypothetical protein ACJ78X_06625, partial [Myxococcales bacterium]